MNNSPLNNSDKERFLNDLKESTKDLGKITKRFLEPIINYVKINYNNIDNDKKEKIKNFFDRLKQTGNKGIGEIRNFIKSLNDPKEINIKPKEKEDKKENNRQEKTDEKTNS